MPSLDRALGIVPTFLGPGGSTGDAPALATDGDNSTACICGPTVQSGIQTYVVGLDLKAPYAPTQIHFYTGNDGQPSGLWTSYVLAASGDGVTYATESSGALTWMSPSDYWFDINLADMPAKRFWRLTLTSADGGLRFVTGTQLNTLAVFAPDSVGVRTLISFN